MILSGMTGLNGLRSLSNYLKIVVHPPFDSSDLLRWEWVECVSAFDTLIHDLVRIGMMEIFWNKRLPTKKVSNFQISYNDFNNMRENIGIESDIFERSIILKHSYLAFQAPDKVMDALSYIWNENNKKTCIVQKLKQHKISMDESTWSNTLNNIVIRRNQIVHEGDYVDRTSDLRQIITQTDVEYTKNFILKSGKVIYDCVK